MTLLEYDSSDSSDSDSDDEFDSRNYSKSVYYKFLNIVKTMLNPKAEERPTALKEFNKLLISNELEGFQIYSSKNLIIHIHNLVIKDTQIQKDSVPMNPIM